MTVATVGSQVLEYSPCHVADDIDEPAWRHTGIEIKASTTLQRPDLTQKIIHTATTYGHAHLKGPPGTGKTSALQLVCSQIEAPCGFFSMSEDLSVEVQLMDALRKVGDDPHGGPRFIICDEIQRTYSPERASEWVALLKDTPYDGRTFQEHHNFVLITAATVRLGSDPASPLSIRENSELIMKELYLTPDEGKELINRYLQLVPQRIRLRTLSTSREWASLVTALIEQCGGHAVAITIALETLYQESRNNEHVTVVDLMTLLLSKLMILGYTRIWASGSMVLSEAHKIEVMRAIMFEHEVVSVAAQKALIRIFILHDNEEEEPQPWYLLKPRVVTPLAYRRFLLYLFPHKPATQAPASIKDLLEKAVSCMRMEDLIHATEESHGDSDDHGIPKETSLQHMFYLGLTQWLPACTEVVPEASAIFPSGKGEVDFYINSSLHWAFELLRNSKKLTEHMRRFQNGGKYFTPNIQQYLVVNFVGPNYSKPKQWPANRAVVKFEKGFASCIVMYDLDDHKEIKLTSSS